jgi:hypothetical protein
MISTAHIFLKLAQAAGWRTFLFNPNMAFLSVHPGRYLSRWNRLETVGTILNLTGNT